MSKKEFLLMFMINSKLQKEIRNISQKERIDFLSRFKKKEHAYIRTSKPNPVTVQVDLSCHSSYKAILIDRRD